MQGLSESEIFELFRSFIRVTITAFLEIDKPSRLNLSTGKKTSKKFPTTIEKYQKLLCLKCVLHV